MSSFPCGCDREARWTCEQHRADLARRPWKERVTLESPLGAVDRKGIEQNKRYARRCMRDSLLRGEAPFASHLLYDHLEILDDMIREERELGIKAGLEWIEVSDKTVVYTDMGISQGMDRGIKEAERVGRTIEYRKIDG